MTTTEAITSANEQRPNVISDDQKYKWLFELEGKIADILDMEEVPQNTFPVPSELLLSSPINNVYPLYLIAQIDFYEMETALYQIDTQMFNAAWDDARAWIRRHNEPVQKVRGFKLR